MEPVHAPAGWFEAPEEKPHMADCPCFVGEDSEPDERAVCQCKAIIAEMKADFALKMRGGE